MGLTWYPELGFYYINFAVRRFISNLLRRNRKGHRKGRVYEEEKPSKGIISGKVPVCTSFTTSYN
jgi:hypothetical protein